MKKNSVLALSGVGLLKNAKFVAAAIVGAMLLGGSPANAAIMDFDGLSGNPDYWEEENFLFMPANNSQDTKCYDNRCLIELKNGEVTTMTYDTPADDDASGNAALGAGASDAALADVYDDPFNLDFFYFLLVGNGTGNFFTVTGTYADLTTVSATVELTDFLGPVATGATTSFAKAPTGRCDDATTTIDTNCGYWVDLDDSWNDLMSVTWTASTDANFRLDCVGANESGRGDGCDPSIVPVPLPATIWLLLVGLVSLGVSRRRKGKGGNMI